MGRLSELSYSKRKKIALVLLIGPIIFLIFAYFLLVKVTDLGYLSFATNYIFMKIFLLGIVIGTPLGIILLSKKESIDGFKYNKTMIIFAIVLFIILLSLFIYFLIPLPFWPGSLATGKIQTLNSYIQQLRYCKYPATC